MHRNFEVQNFMWWESRERRCLWASGVLSPSAKHVTANYRNILLPGVISASTELQLLASASLGCRSLTASICAVSISQGEEGRTGRSNFKRCFYHFLVNFLINILCWESLVQKNTTFYLFIYLFIAWMYHCI